MLDRYVFNPITLLTDTTYGLALLLAVASAITAIVLFARPKGKRQGGLAALFLVSAAFMVVVAWDIHRVSTAPVRLGITIATSNEAMGFGVYGVLIDARGYGINADTPMAPAGQLFVDSDPSSQFILFLSVLVLGFLCYQLYKAAKGRNTLTWVACGAALAMLVMVMIEQVKYQFDMSSRYWNALSQAQSVGSDVLFYLLCACVFLAGCTLAVRYAVKKAREDERANASVI